MRPRTRAAGAAACLALAGLVFAVAGPIGDVDDTARWVDPADSTAGASADAAPAAMRQTPGGQTAPGKPLPGAAALHELRRAVDEPPAVRIVDGQVRTLSAAPGHPLRLPLGVRPKAGAEATATAFVTRYGSAFGIGAAQTTRRLRTDRLPGGDTSVRFTQYAGGLPVLGGEVVVTLDRNNSVLAATAEAAPTAPVSTGARISAQAAGRTAVSAVGKELGLAESRLVAGDAKLWLYDPRLIGAPGRAELRPTWWVKVHDAGRQDGDGLGSALVDAADGSVSLVVAEQRYARDRVVCDLANRAVDLNDLGAYWCSADPSGPAISRYEGGPTSTVTEVNRVYGYLGDTYDFYKNNFGRDSIDGRGMQIRATVRACDLSYCPFYNAFWDGTQLVFGDGFGADDVVAHEYTHGVTDHVSGLFYAFQSGAINEAFSDIMGEFVDLANSVPNNDNGPRWRIGEDLPASVGALRDMANPEQYWQPAYVGGLYYYSGFSDNGGVHTNSGVVNHTAELIADGDGPAQTIRGIGLAKSAQLWYRAMYLVTSGSGFADLAAALTAGCRELVGRYGFVRDDCAQVDKATLATKLSYDPRAGGQVSPEPCNTPDRQPAVRLYQDDMERGGGWTLDSPVWQSIPSPYLPVSWAHSGSRALYGDTPYNGPTGYATMRAPVSIPAGETHFALYYNVPTANTSGGGLSIEYDAGSGWQALAVPGSPLPTGASTLGYLAASYDVSSLAGKNVRFRFKVSSTSREREWLVDDVRVYQCVVAPAQPRDLTAELDSTGTTATITWASAAVDHYEVSVSPVVPGAPTIVAPTAGTTSITLTGLDPKMVYMVTVRAVDGQGGTSLPAQLRFSSVPPVDCTIGGVVNNRPVCPQRPGELRGHPA